MVLVYRITESYEDGMKKHGLLLIALSFAGAASAQEVVRIGHAAAMTGPDAGSPARRRGRRPHRLRPGLGHGIRHRPAPAGRERGGEGVHDQLGDRLLGDPDPYPRQQPGPGVLRRDERGGRPDAAPDEA